MFGFEFTDAQLLSISQFKEKTEFRTKAMGAAKGLINVEREKYKRRRPIQMTVLSWEICLVLMQNKGGHTFDICELSF